MLQSLLRLVQKALGAISCVAQKAGGKHLSHLRCCDATATAIRIKLHFVNIVSRCGGCIHLSFAESFKPWSRCGTRGLLSGSDEGKRRAHTGSQGGSGGEKEIIASYVLTASLSYALCPDGASRPVFGTIVLDEAFSKSSQAVAARIIQALREFGLHALFVTPNKEVRLLRNHTRSAVVVHRRGAQATLASLRWEEIDAFRRSAPSTPSAPTGIEA